MRRRQKTMMKKIVPQAKLMKQIAPQARFF